MATSAAVIAEAAEPDLVITRVFEAPPDLVFKRWTQGEHLVHRSGPHGFTITHSEGDVRPGGAWRCCMRSPDGADHWLGGVYREIVEPERLVFTHVWEDEGRPGNQTLVAVTFAEQDGKTKLTFQQAGFESVASRDSDEKGWTGCLDRLAGYLATV
jgi:uncharacterized protein YndB with AHSA1/START domain